VVKVSPELVHTVFGGESDDALACDGKTTCVLMIQAPWCGACKHLNRQILDPLRQVMGDEHPDAGLLLIAMGDTPEKLESFAAGLEVPYITDQPGAWLRTFKLRSVPSFVVVESRGKARIVGNDIRADGQTRLDAVRNMVKDKFGLGS